MYIDAEVMKDCLKRLDNLNKGRISKRFSYTKSVFDEMEGIKVEINEFPKVVKYEDEKIKSLGSDIGRNIFSPCNIGLTNDKRYGGVLLQKKYFEDERFDKKIAKSDKNLNSEERGELVKDILSIIGGFDSRGKMKDEYRILSNAQTSKDDFDSTLQSNGQYAWINSHFADNTLFCEFVDFVKNCKPDQDTKIDSKWYENIALCYPYADEKKTIGKLSGEKKEKPLEGQEAKEQQEILAYRFPLKFLWMWANRNRFIHPLSLMAFREFLKSDFMRNIFQGEKSEFQSLTYDRNEKGGDIKLGDQISDYAKKITNAKIEFFPTIWQKVSDAIMKKLYGEDFFNQERQDRLKRVSEIVSLLILGETDMANIDELLKTHKQIILYGVPGTGKTHSAKELIRKWSQEEFKDVEKSKRDQDEIDRLQLSKLLLDSENVESKQDGGKKIERDIKIVWEIMQFHPNTTYQDFIGGIAPKTDDKGSLSYKLRNGKFKKFCEYARVNSDKKFVFIIDEINRANLSEVLGELLYALEYRDEEITIPNFDEPFVIPSNVYIIGTMNNVDKSLSTFDLALRRRFGFYEVGVDCEVIEKMLEGKVEKDCLEKYIERCQDLNALISGDFDEEDKERLSKEENNTLKLEKHYKIGQAYFAKIEKFFESNESNEITPIHLTKLWDYHLQPLIEEYIGFSMGNQEISNKLDNLKAFWIRELK